MPNKITDPTKQLETLVAHQHILERVLHSLTGLTVKVSLSVHSTSNSTADLLNLFEASQSMQEFETQSTSRKTWITHTSLSRNVSVFMPEGFDADELHPELEDDEGYNLAVENANARQTQQKPRIVEWAESDNDEPFDPSSTKRPF